MISLNENLGGGPEEDPAPSQFDAVWKEQVAAKIKAFGEPPFGHGWTENALCISLPGEKRPLDSANHFTVTRDGEQFAILKMPVRWLARDEAINLAAWLVAIADPERKEFERVLAEIRK